MRQFWVVLSGQAGSSTFPSSESGFTKNSVEQAGYPLIMQPLRSGNRVYSSLTNFLAAQEDIMPTHPKVPATPANCEKDHERKMKLNEEFNDFESLVRREAKKSREVRELLVPLASLKKAIIFGAHGFYLVPVALPKEKRKVLTARAKRRAGRVK